MSTLTIRCVISAFVLFAFHPLRGEAVQIAAYAGQFIVQAKLVQNSCVPEITQNAHKIAVRLNNCDLLPPSLSVVFSRDAQNIRLGPTVENTTVPPGTTYLIDIRDFSSVTAKPELLDAVLQLTYL